MSTDRFLPLATEEDLESALTRSHDEPIVLFKHSAICTLSARANSKMAALEEGDAPVYRLIVQRSRKLSNAIEQRFEIRHESPQAIVVRDGHPVAHTSHRGVTADFVREHATEAA